MKIATYNIQSLFHRHIDLIEENRILKNRVWQEEFDHLLAKVEKTISQFERLRELSEFLEFSKSDMAPSISLKNIDGNLVARYSPGPNPIKASHLTNWNGSFRLSSMPISKRSFQNKASVILDTDADILVLQEVESRNSLMQLNNIYLKSKMPSPYKTVFHMAGNDCKGMGMGLFLKEGFYLKSIKTFANELDEDDNFRFENDLQLYKIELKKGGCLCILNCHFVSSNLDNEYFRLRRRGQITRMTEIYGELLGKGYENIVVAGTLNAPSYSDLISLLYGATDLKDSVKHLSFATELDNGADINYYRMGAYGKGVNVEQNDYLMLSPTLFRKIITCGLNRKAVWPLTKPQWSIYGTIRHERDAASEHPLLWADLRLEDTVRLLKRSA